MDATIILWSHALAALLFAGLALSQVRDGAMIEPCGLRDFAAGRLAKFKLPARIWFSDAPLPKLGTGKVDKKALRAVYGVGAV